MKMLDGKKRIEFMYHQGIAYAARNYYKSVDEAYDAFKNFKPYKPVNIGENKGYDFKSFKAGYDKVNKLYRRIGSMQLISRNYLKSLLTEVENQVS